jgi:hypothetical protein
MLSKQRTPTPLTRNPDEAQRNPGKRTLHERANALIPPGLEIPDSAALHPGYECFLR